MKLQENHLLLIAIILFASWLFFVVWAIHDRETMELKLRTVPMEMKK